MLWHFAPAISFTGLALNQIMQRGSDKESQKTLRRLVRLAMI